MQYSHEIRPARNDGGRRLGETVDLTNVSESDDEVRKNVRSILHNLPLIMAAPKAADKTKSERILSYRGPTDEDRNINQMPQIAIFSDFKTLAQRSGTAMRNFLSIREQTYSEASEIEMLQGSLNRQMQIKNEAEQRRRSIAGSNDTITTDYDETLEDIQNCARVIAQLNNKLVQLLAVHSKTKESLSESEKETRFIYSECKRFIKSFSDPRQLVKPFSVCGTLLDCHLSDNIVTSFLTTRQYGISQSDLSSYHRQIGRPLGPSVTSEMRKKIFSSRFSHALTINAHLTFPIYCLQFDKSGRYFVTGADDCLVKVFCLGASQSRATQGRPLKCTYGANARGAILVCTLRGHAGVICDIDVSADNAFLATASDDGDVRVWGLKDGCPIAILRGHVGGANMVSWSSLTPYRLVSSGMDGLARIWDVREAALKRYASHIGARSEYTLPLTQNEKRLLQVETSAEQHNSTGGNAQPAMVPPIPQREATADVPAPPVDPGANIALPQPPAQPDEGTDNAENANNEINTGAFVANDALDEGVRIIGKLQHGERREESSGPGTRSRHRTVKVICVAKCPLGGHFATGSDDGHCRVWQDDEDIRVALIDARTSKSKSTVISQAKKISSNRNAVPSTSTLLTTLMGHMSSITDLHYSHAGDRILTASQKDGNARIWSFGFQNQAMFSRNMRDRFSDAKQIVLRLSNINEAPAMSASGRSGKKRSSASTSSVNCDVAVWSRDDTKIITSQSCPLKGKNQDVVPGSQVLLIWDSWTGNCLIAIKQAHEQQCPVIVTHPFEQNIICSAGGDGVAKVWDLEKGKCIYQHRNVIDHGPVSQNNEKRKSSGFLDGAFDENGQTLILVDDNGRVTLFDCFGKPKNNEDLRSPIWMKEQYFASDYYELFYNTNGYCVERGSEQPPHIAPRAARCNHSGVPYPEDISETYLSLKGPSPILDDVASRQRSTLRSKAKSIPTRGEHTRRAILMTDFDPEETLQIDGTEDMISQVQGKSRRIALSPLSTENENDNDTRVQRNSNTSRRALSGNYRWRDFDDLVREERLQSDAGDIDVDDEDFVPQVAGSQEAADEDGYSSLDESERGNAESWASGSEVSPPRASSRARASARSQRIRRRNRDRDVLEVEERMTDRNTRPSSRRRIEQEESDSDDANYFVEECLSTNNAPTGAHVTDYTEAGHFFRLNSNARVRRAWLCRTESASSYRGRKIYSPQVGDSVVYIPRAHRETIRKFLTLKTPWRSWPAGARWPIVRCQIINARYRFPYKEYFRRGVESRCESVVTILTLEVTGIPELSNDREFPWPKPAFIARQTRSASHKFEVSVFENECAEYVIPETLFLWRIQCLEEALRARANNPEHFKILACYFGTTDEEDPVIESSEAEIMEYCNADDQFDENLNKSGFESLNVRWDDGSSESLSPWEVTTSEKAYEVPSPPPLSAVEKSAVAKSLRSIEMRNDFGEFLKAVDVGRYPDYLSRIEVPMDLSFVKLRLEHDYYTSVLSLLSEIRLIRENCQKYNGPNSPIAGLANDMYIFFREELRTNLAEAGVHADVVKRLDHETNFPLCANDSTTVEDSTRPNTRAHRATTRQSSLELLPPPPQSSSCAAATVDSNGSREQAQRSIAKREMSWQGSSSDNSDHDSINDTRPVITESSSRPRRRSSRKPAATSNAKPDTRSSNKRGITTKSTSRVSQHTDSPNYAEVESENEEEYPVKDSESEDEDSGAEDTGKSEFSHDEEDFDTDESEEDILEKARKDRSETRKTRASREEPATRSSSRKRERVKGDASDGDTYDMGRSRRLRVTKNEGVSIGFSRTRGETTTRTRTRQGLSTTAMSNAESPTRQSSRARKETNYQDLDSDIEIFEEEEAINGESENSVITECHEDINSNRISPSRRSTRLSKTQYNDAASYPEESSVDDTTSEQKTNRRSPRSNKIQEKRRSTSLRASSRTRKSLYVEAESDEEDDHSEKVSYHEDESDGDADTEEDSVESDSRVKSKRRRNTEKRASPTRKRSRTSRYQKGYSEGESSLPELEKWPDVSLKDITKISECVLDEMRSLDSMDLFNIPVIEAYPDISEAYSKQIESPIDFRTIEEEKLPHYSKISQLQVDLIQVFKNCVEFNGESSDLGQYAINLGGQLNDVFFTARDKIMGGRRSSGRRIKEAH